MVCLYYGVTACNGCINRRLFDVPRSNLDETVPDSDKNVNKT